MVSRLPLVLLSLHLCLLPCNAHSSADGFPPQTSALWKLQGLVLLGKPAGLCTESAVRERVRRASVAGDICRWPDGGGGHPHAARPAGGGLQSLAGAGRCGECASGLPLPKETHAGR